MRIREESNIIIDKIILFNVLLVILLLQLFSQSEKQKLIVPWMIGYTTYILWCMIAFILFFSSPVTPPTFLVSLRMRKSFDKLIHLHFKDFIKTASHAAWEEIAIYLTLVVLNLYFLLVVWSFFKKLKRHDKVNVICQEQKYCYRVKI